jgi:hypothetical protein
MRGGGHPQATGGVEGKIEGLTELRLRRYELDREAGREVKQALLLRSGTHPSVRRIAALRQERRHKGYDAKDPSDGTQSAAGRHRGLRKTGGLPRKAPAPPEVNADEAVDALVRDPR